MCDFNERPSWAEGLIAFAAILVTAAVVLFAFPARGEVVQDSVAAACKTLKTRLTVKAAAQWSEAIRFASAEAGIPDPYVVVAMVMRESSFDPQVASGRRPGRLGEIGPLQVHGVALRFAPPECRGKLGHSRCLLRTGTRFLAHKAKRCPGSTWRVVASYGRKRCASESSARKGKAARRAFEFYKRIVKGGSWDWEWISPHHPG